MYGNASKTKFLIDLKLRFKCKTKFSIPAKAKQNLTSPFKGYAIREGGNALPSVI